jgi:uncharacterized protein (DUF1800 family)
VGFGASATDRDVYANAPSTALVQTLLDYHRAPDEVDDRIGNLDYAGITTRGEFSPDTVINDARQRWLFRMVHTRRPLQEKMALFWHNHFATAYSKVAGVVGAVQATKMMDGRPQALGGAGRGQIQLFRDMATGSFRDLLVEVARDPAMLVWLDGRSNVRTRPQENFARELMELFTVGIGQFTESDVVSAARVFTGWNLSISGDRGDAVNSHYQFFFNQNQHDTAAKEFSFAVYPGGGRTIPARAAAAGMQDGLDLIDALARHPATASRLAAKLYRYFINDVDEVDEGLVRQAARAYADGNFSIRAMLQRLLLSPAFLGGSNLFRRYSWPVEFVVRAIKEAGWRGFSVNDAVAALANMGQQLYEPPDVNGWALGAEWFSTASMLARMNFAAALTGNQKFNLASDARPYRQAPHQVLEHLMTRFPSAGFSGDGHAAILDYMRTGAQWTGAEAQLNTKVAGAARLIVGSGEYQFN